MYTTTSPIDFYGEIFYNEIILITEEKKRKLKKKKVGNVLWK